jgi:parallel beta-helix repeat protein
MIINNEVRSNGGSVPSLGGGGGIGLLGSDSNTISDNIVSNNITGIGLALSYNNIVVHNVLMNNSDGMDLSFCSGNIVRDNVITSNSDGIALDDSSGNIVEHNQIFKNGIGVGIGYSSGDLIKENNITENTIHGIAIAETSTNITVVGNNISYNYYGIKVHYSNGSIIHHNNLINNTKNAPEDVYPNINTWNDGYPSGGNYWSDYNGTDFYSGSYQNETGSDGIGDALHTLDPRNQDRFPLMAPISFFDVGAWNKTACQIQLISNSTITNFQVTKTEKKISFNVTGPDTIIGFCRITIPTVIIQELWNNNYTILIDGTPPLTTNSWTDDKHTYIYFAYVHSEHEIKILPEFPAALILPLLIIATLLASYHKREEMRRWKYG